jgi:hypothetical protein
MVILSFTHLLGVQGATERLAWHCQQTLMVVTRVDSFLNGKFRSSFAAFVGKPMPTPPAREGPTREDWALGQFVSPPMAPAAGHGAGYRGTPAADHLPSLTPGPPPFLSMNATPADSKARLTTSTVARRGWLAFDSN